MQLPIFAQLKKELSEVYFTLHNSITTPGITKPQEQIESLSRWQEFRYYVLYYNSTDTRYSKGANQLKEELNAYRQKLRDENLNLDDFIVELNLYVDRWIEPFREEIQIGISALEVELENNPEPIVPKGYAVEENGLSSITYFPGEYERYRMLYERWVAERREPLYLREKLNSLVADLDFIIHAIEDLGLRNSLNNHMTAAEDNISELKVSTTDDTINPRFSDFREYIDSNYYDKLLPYLIKNYTDSTPRIIVPMLYALVELDILTKNALHYNQRKLHKALQNTFGSIGGRTGLNDALHRYGQENLPDEHRREITSHTKKIEAYLKEIYRSEN